MYTDKIKNVADIDGILQKIKKILFMNNYPKTVFKDYTKYSIPLIGTTIIKNKKEESKDNIFFF